MDYFEQLTQLDSFLINDVEPPKTAKNSTDSQEYVCKYCNAINSLIYDYRNASEVCNECGVIADKMENVGQEWTNYGAADNRNTDQTRCGKPINPLLPKSSMGTCMSSNGKYKNLNRLHQWNQMPADERSLYEVFKNIDMLMKGTTLNAKIIGETKQYYKALSEKDEKIKGYLTRGNIRKSLISACMLVACKNNNKPMREVEIAKICDITQTDVTIGLKKFSELEKNKNLQINSHENNIHDFINKYCSKLNINENITKIVHLLYIRAKKINLLRNSNNTSICSGLLYFISEIFELKIKKSEIIKIVNVSEVTLNKVYKEFLGKNGKTKRILLIGFDKIDFVN